MQWKSIPGFEGHYEASDTGLIRSLDRIIDAHHGNRWKPGVSVAAPRRMKGRILKPGAAPSGHLHVVLEGRDTRLVHVLVLETFIGPCPPSMECCHADDDPSNNRLENLSWGTRSQNSRDAIDNGRHFHAGVTHCKRGHELTPENTQRHKSGKRRTCLACRRERQALYNRGERVVREGFCPKGHPKIPENRYSNGAGRTRCKLCVSESRNL